MTVPEQSPEPVRYVDEENERVRRERIRRDAARPMAVNLAEGIALSESLSQWTGIASASAPERR